ncbi:MAG: hypothetical protein GC149_20310 [Gammaproteobacteria bacterium]|nr:hypothetical protein [Gammaproteobacteria bacterium]
MQDLILWAIGTAISLGAALTGWVFKMVFSSIKDVENNHKLLVKSLSDHKLHAAETFATKQDVRDGFDRVMTKLDKIDEKLDGKADKQ